MQNLAGSSWLPIELTAMARSVDHLFYILLVIVAVFFVLVEFLLAYFLIRYRRTKRNRVGANIHGNNRLEMLWTAVPFVILAVLGAYSVQYIYRLQTPPAPVYTIHVVGHKWYWEFRYPNGADTQNVLMVPAGQNVLFDITSMDVVHGFYIPDFRLQQDAVPGRLTQFSVNVRSVDTGTRFIIPCDQFCGAGHPTMIAHGQVLSPNKFKAWMAATLKQQSSGA